MTQIITHGFKATAADMTCRNLQYSIGTKITIDGELEICYNGLHFCQKLEDVFEYYSFNGQNRYFKCISYGNVVTKGNKSATMCLELVEEISYPNLFKIAVSQNGRVLQFVNEQTPELCKIAVSQNGYALEYVKEQTPELCEIAVTN